MENPDQLVDEIRKNRRILWLILGVLLLGLGMVLTPSRDSTGATVLKLFFLYCGIGILVINVLRIAIAAARQKDKPDSYRGSE